MSKTGVSMVDITPPIGMEFIGYHRPNGIQNIDERIFATAIIFETTENKMVVISIDNIGMLIEDTTEIREKVAKELSLPVKNIMVVFTHTHSGPATASKGPTVEAYRTHLVSRAVQVAVLANENMFPSEIGWNVTVGELGVNRREKAANGKVKMGTNLDGVVDRRIGLLAIKNQETAEIGGIIIFCTAHPNVLKGDSDILSADYPGRTRQILQQTLNCPVVVIQGAAGNINAKYRGSMEALNKMANILSESVLSMIPTIEFKPIHTLKTATAMLPMELKKIPNPTGIDAMATMAEKEWGVNTTKWRTALLDMHKQDMRDLNIDIEMQLIQINEGSFSGIPMEPFAETAIDLKNILVNELAFFGGYTNGYLGYLPTKEAYPYGGYEVELNPVVYGPITSLWMPPAENTSERIVEKIIELYS